MSKHLFKCMNCKTVMIYETIDESLVIPDAPQCICGKDTMISIASRKYAYGAWE